jgi:hypothetical protein
MTANELLDIIEELDAAGYIATPKAVQERLRYIANLSDDPMEAARMFTDECDESHPSLSAGERNR